MKNDQTFTFNDIICLKTGNYQLALSEKVVEHIKNSRNTMEEASKHNFPKLDEANRGFLSKSSDKFDKKQQQILLLHSNLNGIGKSLKPETIKFFFQ